MKKKNFKSLRLNKKSISNFNETSVSGGGVNTLHLLCSGGCSGGATKSLHPLSCQSDCRSCEFITPNESFDTQC